MIRTRHAPGAVTFRASRQIPIIIVKGTSAFYFRSCRCLNACYVALGSLALQLEAQVYDVASDCYLCIVYLFYPGLHNISPDFIYVSNVLVSN